MPRQHSIEEYAEALRKAEGFRTVVAEMLGVSYQAVCKRIKGNKTLQEIDKEIGEKHLDFCETKLLKAIKANQPWAICFYLKCKGKERGFVERQEITGKGGQPIKTEQKEVNLKKLSLLTDEELKQLRKIQQKLSDSNS